MRATLLASLAISASAEYDSCHRPWVEWTSIDQAVGQSYMYGIGQLGTTLYAAGVAHGNFSMSTKRVDGPGQSTSTGETDDHTKIVDPHQTGSFAEGGYSDPTTSQHGSDAVVISMSLTGEPGPMFTADVGTADGIYTSESVNGGYGGWGYCRWIKPNKAGDKLIVGGDFRGMLTMEMTTGDMKSLINPKNGNVDGFIVQIDPTTMKAEWATHIDIGATPDRTYLFGQDSGRTYYRGLYVTDSDHIFYAGYHRGPQEGNLTDGTYGSINPDRKYLGTLSKFDSAGVRMWTFQESRFRFYNIDGHGEDAIVGGIWYWAKDDTSLPGTTFTTSSDGEENSAVIAMIGADGKAKWVKEIAGEDSVVYQVATEGDHVYACGELEDGDTWSLDGDCALTNPSAGGFLAKFNAADGTCIWAKDVPKCSNYYETMTIQNDADGEFVYIGFYDDEPVKFDSTHTVAPRGAQHDMFLAKYAASGMGEWAVSVGSSGNDRVYGIFASTDGLVAAGYTQSEGLAMGKMGDVMMKNLQHQAAEAGGTDKVNSGNRAAWVVKLAKEGNIPTCLESCTTSTTATDVKIKAGNCMVDNTCLANGDFSETLVCFKCNTGYDTKKLEGPILDNHCYFDDKCYSPGDAPPSYRRYNSVSVCETCDPAQDTGGWSVAPGWVHDRDLAMAENMKGGSGSGTNLNEYGMLFDSASNGCQLMPEVEKPYPASATAMAEVAKNVAAATSLSAMEALMTSDVKAMTGYDHVKHAIDGTGPFKGVGSPQRLAFVKVMMQNSMPVIAAEEHIEKNVLDANGWKKAWALYYSGAPDYKSCTVAAEGTSPPTLCSYAPAASADAIAAHFGTTFHYSESVSRVKVSQKMSLGHGNAHTTRHRHEGLDGNSVIVGKDETLGKMMAADAAAHMQIPLKQAVLKHMYDAETSSAGSKIAQAQAYAYWQAIKANLLVADPARAAYVDEVLLGSLVNDGSDIHTFAYCTIKGLMEAHLPEGSNLQYMTLFNDEVITTETGDEETLHAVTTILKDTRVNMVAEDLGEYAAAKDMDCSNAPPPSASPNPPPSPPPPAPLVPVKAGQKKDDDDELSDGELIGIIVGASVFAVLLFGFIGYVVYQKKMGGGKPIFTCLDSDQKGTKGQPAV